jgi:hypothetical protein
MLAVDVPTPADSALGTNVTIFQGSTSAQMMLHNKHVNAYLVDSLKVLMLQEPFPAVMNFPARTLASYAAAITIRGSATSGGALMVTHATHAVVVSVD